MTSLHPFFCFVLLQYGNTAIAASLHSNLVRVGSSLASTAMLRQLSSLLPGYRMQTTEQQCLLDGCATDLLDLFFSCGCSGREQEVASEQRESLDTLLTGISSLLQDMYRLHRGNGSRALLKTLATISSSWPRSVFNFCTATTTSTTANTRTALLMQLASIGASAAPSDAIPSLSLLHDILSYGNPYNNDDCHVLPRGIHAAITTTLVPVVAFQQVSGVKAWASQILGVLENYSSRCSGTIELEQQQEQQKEWVASLHYDLTLFAKTTKLPKGASVNMHPATWHTLLSLIYSPPSTALCTEQAIATMLHVVRVVQGMSLPTLSLCIHRIQSLVAEEDEPGLGKNNKKSKRKRALSSHTIVRLLYAIPLLATTTTTTNALPFIVRAIQPLLSSPTPLLQAVAVRMLCMLWTTTGRGFPHLRTALLSYTTPTPTSHSKALALAWSQSVIDVCTKDGQRAGELIHAITTSIQCLHSDPDICAFGLQCIAHLCENDVLDFYKAWRVVHGYIPKMPSASDAAAAAWLRLLGSGCFDVEKHPPEISRRIVDALWKGVTTHASSFVRGQAAASLAARDVGALIACGAIELEMWEIANLLQHLDGADTGSSSSKNSREMEALVVRVLEHEHQHRRRPNATNTTTINNRVASYTTPSIENSSRKPKKVHYNTGDASLSRSTVGNVRHRLASTLARSLLGPGSRVPSEFLKRLPDVSPTAVLLLWSPPPTPLSSKTKTNSAKIAVDWYTSVFKEVCKHYNTGTKDMESSTDPGAGWIPFLRRWSTACEDATGNASLVWNTIEGIETGGSISERVNAVTASAAFITVCALRQKQHQQQRDMEAAHGMLRALCESSEEHGIRGQVAACIALGQCAGAVAGVCGVSVVVDDVLKVLLPLWHGDEERGSVGGVVQACAIGIGHACLQITVAKRKGSGSGSGSSSVKEDDDVVGTVVKKALCALLEVVVVVENTTLKARTEAAMQGLTIAMAALVALNMIDSLIDLFFASSAVVVHMQRLLTTFEPGPVAALLQATTAAAFSMNKVTRQQVVEVLEVLKACAMYGGVGVVSRKDGAYDGKLGGAGAAALGALVAELALQGFSFDRDAPREGYITAIVIAGGGKREEEEGQGIMTTSTVARYGGAAAGIASVFKHRMAEDDDDRRLEKVEKEAMEVLEALALGRREDRGSRRECSKALAELCWFARRCEVARSVGVEGGGVNETEERVSKGLSSLPENSAMRYLCETLSQGCWPQVEEEENEVVVPSASPEVTSQQAASILRCLAAAPRLPSMNWSSVCRRLIHSHSGDVSVVLGCIGLAAAHASAPPSLQLYDFISTDLLSPSSSPLFSHIMHPYAEVHVEIVRAMPQLLAALPDAEAASAVCMLCTFIATTVTTSTALSSNEKMKECMLHSLATILSSSSSSPRLKEAAVTCAFDTLLPTLRPPPHLSSLLLFPRRGFTYTRRQYRG